ncbi:DNA adenine methylase [Xanthomonas graminis]|uniref:DNA adenine methylase n=1 Tax=Xanthomonas graminis TaxID=3390026 RepID=UPI001F298F3F|nr:DNA adenine methylase [Xanthomonas translucens]UKE73243.1 DNA adenine methylase [Xanthomonas translucens pv. phleipratensis]
MADSETQVIRSPAFRYHGGKFRLAPWVLANFPPHQVYVEPFGGAVGVLLQKARSHGEVYNDLDGDVVNFFRVVRDTAMRAQLAEACVLTPYARIEFESAWEPTEDPVERARRLLVRAQMGFGSAGATKGATGLRIDANRRYGTAQQLWAEFPAGLAAVSRCFVGVLIEQRPAIEVMAQHDAAETLHYVDPPYPHSTRVMQNGKAGYYRHEIWDFDHHCLIDTLRSLRGAVVVSGYPSDLYDHGLRDWLRRDTSARISAGRGAGRRTECLWLNPAAAAQLRQPRLAFGGVE